MSDNEFEPYKVPALGKAIARAFVTIGSAFGSLAPPNIAADPKQSYLNLINRYAWFLIPFWLLLIGTVSFTLFSLFDGHFRAGAIASADIRWRYLSITAMIAALGAMIAVPFTLVRVYVNERQARTAEEGLITDRITKAIQQLGAEKTVKSQVEKKQVKAGRVFTEMVVDERTEPNLEVRLGAIYALERIAEDSERDHIPIMETLCAYVRENSRRRQAQDFPEEPWVRVEDHADEAARREYLERRRKRLIDPFSEGNARNWSKSLLSPQADIQAVLSVLGRRGQDRLDYEAMQERPYRLDLRSANLQGADMSNLRLGSALFGDARLEGANLAAAVLDGADFRNANLEGANLSGAKLERANLSEVKLEFALISRANMAGAILNGAHLEGVRLDAVILEDAHLNGAKMEAAKLSNAKAARANFRDAKMEEAYFFRAEMAGASLIGTELEGASFQHANLEGARFDHAKLNRVKFSSANLVKANFEGAVMLEANFSSAKMEGANLKGASLEGANLIRTDMRSADLLNCTFFRTLARWADFSQARNLSQAQVNSLFGDMDTKLPQDSQRTSELAHASRRDLADGDPEFERWKAAGYPEGVPIKVN